MEAANTEDRKKLLTDALASVDKAATLLPGRAEPFYNKACCQALLGLDNAGILENLKTAFRLDPGLRKLAAKDEDLDSLRNDADLSSLIGGANAADD